MFYVKNVPNWERALRIVIGLIAIGAGLKIVGGTAGLLLAAAAAGIVVSGLFGFCPMCAMVGRRLDQRARTGYEPR
jgi:hypothetical protein